MPSKSHHVASPKPEERGGRASLPDVIVNVPLQGIGAMRQRRVVSSPDVQLIKVLDEDTNRGGEKSQKKKIYQVIQNRRKFQHVYSLGRFFL